MNTSPRPRLLDAITPGSGDWKGVIVQGIAMVCLTALTFKFGTQVLPMTMGILGSVLGAASIRGRMLPPGHTVVPPGYSVMPPPPGGPYPGGYRAPMASHTGFSDSPPDDKPSPKPPPPEKR